MTFPNPKWQPGTGKQVILKEDFVALENAILTQSGVRLNPPLVWVDATTLRLEATADSPAAMQFTGFPNILNPVTQVDGDLCDGKTRTITSNVSMIITSGGIWGTEKSGQIYVVYSLAADGDSVFTLKSMPFMRVKSQAGQIISLGTIVTPATGIGYGFTTDEMIGGMVYFLSGASRGLMRAITANNNDATTGGTVTYGGAALTVAAGDVFIILPPTLNFRMVGAFYNDLAGDIAWHYSLNYYQGIEYSTAGTHPFIMPPWVYFAKEIVCVGGGGGTYAATYAGGGGVEIYGHYPMSPGAYYEVVVGAGGAATTPGHAGEDSSFGTLPHAHGGHINGDPLLAIGGPANTDGSKYRINQASGFDTDAGIGGASGFHLAAESAGVGNTPGGGGYIGTYAGGTGAVYITF
jgi:hypothetical protein